MAQRDSKNIDLTSQEKATTESLTKQDVKPGPSYTEKRKYERTTSTRAIPPFMTYPQPEEDPNEGIIPLIYGGEGVAQVMCPDEVEETELHRNLEGYGLAARSEAKSSHTISIVSASVRYLEEFRIRSGMSTNVRDIGVEELRQYSVSLQHRVRFADHPYTPPQQKTLSGHTINGYLRGLRGFWSWLKREEYIDDNPFLKLKLPKVPIKVIQTFTDEQLQSLFNAIDQKAPQGLRDYVVILLLLDTGVRSSELSNLTLSDVNLKNRTLKVLGKGNKERMVPIGARLQAALWKYINKHRVQPAMPRIENVFLTHEGYPLAKERLGAIVKKYAVKAGITGVRASPHTFRHTMAITFLRNGGDVFSLQRILGHSQLDTVRL